MEQRKERVIERLFLTLCNLMPLTSQQGRCSTIALSSFEIEFFTFQYYGSDQQIA